MGAADIASCARTADDATARLLDAIIAASPGATVFTAGDNAYPKGTAAAFANCYAPTWGRHRDRTRPVPGNAEYETDSAAPYFAYFGTRAGAPDKGYYSYNLGRWHVIALNGTVDMRAGSPQEQWLRADLTRNDRTCTFAYWHHPRFSSGHHGGDPRSAAIWDALYEHGAEIVVGGHDHNYERFTPQTPDGTADSARGIRQFVVGTGGVSLRRMRFRRAPNSAVRNASARGVITFTLFDGGYRWQFIPIPGRSFSDAGADTCH